MMQVINPPPRTSGEWPATAAMWTNSIPGFRKVSSQERGDVTSDGSHCGIAVSSSSVLAGNRTCVEGYSFSDSSTIQRYDG